MWVAALVAVVALMVAVLAVLITQHEANTVSAFNVLQCGVNPARSDDGPQRIPRVIHRTDRKDLTNTHAWRTTAQYNPEYEQRFYGDAEVDAFMRTTLDGTVYPAFKRLCPGAAKADLFRYCLLYERGGVYLDSKSGAYRLADLIRPDDRMLVSAWSFLLGVHGPDRPRYGELQQWWLAVEPKHPAMLRVIRTVVANIDARTTPEECEPDDVRWATLNTTGPLAFSKAIEEAMPHGGIRLVCADGNGVMRYMTTVGHLPGVGYSRGKLLHNKQDAPVAGAA